MKLAYAIFTALAFILISNVSVACPGEGGHKAQCKDGQCPHKQKSNWSNVLELEGEEASQVDALQQQYREKRKQLKSQHKQAWKELKDEQAANLAEILTPDQLQKLEEHKSAHHYHHKGKHGKECPHHSS